MFWYRFRDGDRGIISNRHGYCIRAITVSGNIKCSYGNWRNQLSMEYGPDNCKYYGKSNYNDYLFCNRNEFQWMFGYGNGNGNGKLIS